MKRIRRAKRPRQSLQARMAACGDAPWMRQEIAKYDRHVPGVFRVEFWQKRLYKDSTGKQQVKIFQNEKEAMFSRFFGAFLALDDKFFDETAAAIRAYKKASPADSLLLKLSDPALWVAHPEPSLTEIEKFCAPIKGDIKRIVRRLRIPYTKRVAGHPKKN